MDCRDKPGNDTESGGGPNTTLTLVIPEIA